MAETLESSTYTFVVASRNALNHSRTRFWSVSINDWVLLNQATRWEVPVGNPPPVVNGLPSGWWVRMDEEGDLSIY